MAKERDSSTFLSDLVQTSLACSLLRVPHLKSVRHTSKKKQTGREAYRVTRAGMFGGKLADAGVVRSWARLAEGILASLLNSLCYLWVPGYFLLFPVLAVTGQASKSPTTHRSPRIRQRIWDDSWGQPGGAALSSTTALQQRLLKPPHLLPPVSKKVCSTHAHSRPKSSTASLFKNECLQFPRSGRGKLAREHRR